MGVTAIASEPEPPVTKLAEALVARLTKSLRERGADSVVVELLMAWFKFFHPREVIDSAKPNYR